jgi:hypothetical protein
MSSRQMNKQCWCGGIKMLVSLPSAKVIFITQYPVVSKTKRSSAQMCAPTQNAKENIVKIKKQTLNGCSDLQSK